jgi:hypothetical protein
MSNSTPTPSPLLADERESARLLSISTRKMWQLGASGAIPFIKIGRSKRYAIADLRAYINAQKSGGKLTDIALREESARCERCSREATHHHVTQQIDEQLCDHCCDKNCQHLDGGYWDWSTPEQLA